MEIVRDVNRSATKGFNTMPLTITPSTDDHRDWLRVVDAKGCEVFRVFEGSVNGIGHDRGARDRCERIIRAIEHHAIYEPVGGE